LTQKSTPDYFPRLPMKPLQTGLSVLLVGIMLAPATAAAGQAVPPDNPAAIQYTEAYPTSHGPTDAQHKHQSNPEQALGGRNAERLEAQGQAGEEAARVAAETAPETVGERAGAEATDRTGSGSHVSAAGDGGYTTASASSEGDGGGSGLGDVAGQATGVNSSDGTGLLLPLVLLGGIAWAAFYATRGRRRAAQ
jgi:hypothetical protein